MSTEKQCEIVPTEAARYSYKWEWGDEGLCGVTGRTLLEQQAVNLSRHVAFAELAATGTPPVERAERVAYKAQQFALEEEIKELQASRGALLDEVTRLRADNRLATIQLQTFKPENQQLKALIVTVQKENESLTSVNADQANDLSALRESVRAGDLAVLSERVIALELELEAEREKVSKLELELAESAELAALVPPAEAVTVVE